jgi:polysaccharide chain length determinant protein (PEP-CTERM system associated)
MKDLSGLEIQDYLRIFWKRRWYFLIVFLLVSTAGVLYVNQMPDIYRSEAKIIVDTSLSAVLSNSSRTAVQDRVNILREQLNSRTFLERMIQQMGVHGHGQSGNFAMEQAVRSIQNNIRIDRVTDRTFRISYRATDPQVAQSVTRQVTDELIRVSRRSTVDRTMTVDRFLDEQLAEASKRLSDHSDLIRQFKLTNQGQLPEQTNANMNAIAGYRSQLNSVESFIQQAKNRKETLDHQHHENMRVRAAMEQLRVSTVGPVSSDMTPEERELARIMESLSMREAELAQALARYTENHPDVVAVRREISRLEQDAKIARADLPSFAVTAYGRDAETVVTRSDIEQERLDSEYVRQRRLLELDIERREREREELLRLIALHESRLRIAPTLAQDLETLLREEGLLRRRYETLANQKANTELTTAVETDRMNEVYQVIDEANLPMSAESDRLRLALMSIVGGLVMGVAAAFGRELIDGTIGSEDEAKKVLQLPVLAALPTVSKKIKDKAA